MLVNRSLSGTDDYTLDRNRDNGADSYRPGPPEVRNRTIVSAYQVNQW